MNALIKLTTVAFGTLAIVGGAALAQTNNTNPKADSSTANVSISPGSNLKRDSSLSSTPKATAPMSRAATTDTTTTTSTTSVDTTPVATTTSAPAGNTDVALAPRHDRN